MNQQIGKRRAPSFRPRGMLILLYFAAIFLAIAMLSILPELLGVLRDMAPGPDQEEAAYRIAPEVFGPRLPYSFVLTTLVTALGAYFKVLPGLR